MSIENKSNQKPIIYDSVQTQMQLNHAAYYKTESGIKIIRVSINKEDLQKMQEGDRYGQG